MTVPDTNGSAKWLPLVLAFITGVTSAGGVGVFVTRDLATNDSLHALESRVATLQSDIGVIRERQIVHTDAIASLNTMADELARRVNDLAIQIPDREDFLPVGP